MYRLYRCIDVLGVRERLFENNHRTSNFTIIIIMPTDDTSTRTRASMEDFQAL